MHDEKFPSTANPAWGFYGTIRHHADPDEAPARFWTAEWAATSPTMWQAGSPAA